MVVVWTDCSVCLVDLQILISARESWVLGPVQVCPTGFLHPLTLEPVSGCSAVQLYCYRTGSTVSDAGGTRLARLAGCLEFGDVVAVLYAVRLYAGTGTGSGTQCITLLVL